MRLWNRCALLAPLTLLLLLTGCGGGSGPAGHTRPLHHPGGATDVVVSVSTSGGLMSREMWFGDVPEVTITGDGTVYSYAGPTSRPEQPLIQPMRRGHVSASDVDESLREAALLGLLRRGGDHEARYQVTDASSTTIYLRAEGRRIRHHAYALGMAEESGARAAMLQFERWLQRRYVERGAAWTPERVRVFAHPASSTYGRVRHWPATAGLRLRDADQCGMVLDPATIRLLLRAHLGDRFVDHGRVYAVGAAAVVPGDSCADRARAVLDDS